MSIRTMSQQKLSKAVYNKTSAIAYNRGSVSFTPTGRLTVNDNAALNMGTQDFTWEAWINTTVLSGIMNVMFKGDSYIGSSIGLFVVSGKIAIGGGSGDTTGTSTITSGTWNHIAMTRSGTSRKLWLNGTLQATSTDSTDLTTTGSSFSIGDRTASHPYSQYPYSGLISNVRIVKGTALYASNFSVPTSALTPISGTSLITCQDSDKIVDRSTNAFTVTVTGTASASSSKPFA